MVAGHSNRWTLTALLIIFIGLSLFVHLTSSAKTQSSTEWKRKLSASANHTEESVALNQPIHHHRKSHRHHRHYNTKKASASRRQHNTSAPPPASSNSTSFNSTNPLTQSKSNGGLTPWSPWSKCSKKCLQTRHRKCIRPPPLTNDDDTDHGKLWTSFKKCEETQVLRQERPCRNKGRCKRGSKAFHVVLPPKKESLKQPSVISSNGSNQQQSDVRVLLSLNSIFYSSWSRWSTCTKACTTTRYRTCRFQVVCGNTVLHEEAYCYIEGTECEKWYSGGARYHKEEENVEHNSKPRAERGQQRAKNKNSLGSPGGNRKNGADDFTIADSSNGVECGISAASVPHSLQLRIIGGREAIPGKWPWQVAILNRYKEAFCGGTLIGARWVLTAAHCLRKRLYVRVGEYDLVEDDGTEIDFEVEEVFVHPDYDPETVDNDVALLRLPKAIRLGDGASHQGVGNARLACLPQPGQLLPITQKCTIIGWGKKRSSNVFGTEVLHEAEVPVVTTSACRKVYKDYFITDNMFCAGYLEGLVDSCAGDSGGPLLCQVGDRWTIFGITSFGEGCGKRGKYGIYTKVPNYVSWIQRVIDLNGGIQ